MRHLLMAHQQESFLPFSSRQSLSCCLSRVAKRSTPKPRGPLYSPSEPCGPLPFPQNRMVLPIHSRTMWFSLFTSPKLHDPLLSPPKPCGPPYSLKPRGLFFLWLPGLGLNPSAHLPLQPHFRLLLQSVTPASIPYPSSFTGLP